jgi:hypothetical protein
VLLGGHPRALGRGCLLAALPAPLLADITRAAVDLDTCRIEIDMTVGPLARGAAGLYPEAVQSAASIRARAFLPPLLHEHPQGWAVPVDAGWLPSPLTLVCPTACTAPQQPQQSGTAKRCSISAASTHHLASCRTPGPGSQ